MQLNLGTKIRELRHRDGRTQDNLAEALGVTAQAVSRWESGGSYPDMESMPALANYFGVTIDEMFYGFVTVKRCRKIADYFIFLGLFAFRICRNYFSCFVVVNVSSFFVVES